MYLHLKVFIHQLYCEQRGFFFNFQFFDVAEVAIIHKMI
jgi:hypothetical protein